MIVGKCRTKECPWAIRVDGCLCQWDESTLTKARATRFAEKCMQQPKLCFKQISRAQNKKIKKAWGAELLTSTTDFIGIKAVKSTYSTAIGISEREWTKLTAEEDGKVLDLTLILIRLVPIPFEKNAFFVGSRRARRKLYSAFFQRLDSYLCYPRSWFSWRQRIQFTIIYRIETEEPMTAPHSPRPTFQMPTRTVLLSELFRVPCSGPTRHTIRWSGLIGHSRVEILMSKFAVRGIFARSSHKVPSRIYLSRPAQWCLSMLRKSERIWGRAIEVEKCCARRSKNLMEFSSARKTWFFSTVRSLVPLLRDCFEYTYGLLRGYCCLSLYRKPELQLSAVYIRHTHIWSPHHILENFSFLTVSVKRDEIWNILV